MHLKRKRNIPYLPISILIVTLFSFNTIESTFRDLIKTAAKTLIDLGTFNHNLNTPLAGEETLPQQVQEMLSMVRSHNLQTFYFSNQIGADIWVYQQIIATAWPKRFEFSSKDWFFLVSETVPSRCVVTEKKKEVALVHCP